MACGEDASSQNVKVKPALGDISMSIILYHLKGSLLGFYRRLWLGLGRNCCYKCHRTATSRDHVPPKAIFVRSKTNLITVPSCQKHNNLRSSDDEYLRNILTMHHAAGFSGTTNQEAAVLRSVQRHFQSYKELLESVRVIQINMQRFGEYTYNSEIMHRAISKIGDALYFLDTGDAYFGNWFVYDMSSHLRDSSSHEQYRHAGFHRFLSQLNYTGFLEWANPVDFYCEKWTDNTSPRSIYRLVFYRNIAIIAYACGHRKQTTS